MLMPSGDGEWADMVDTEDTEVTEVTEDTVDTVDTVDTTTTDIMDGMDMEDTAADGTAVNSTTAAWRMFNKPLSYTATAIKPFDVLFLCQFQK
jgi:hypothetical protein